jgi:hypothetical protein
MKLLMTKVSTILMVDLGSINPVDKANFLSYWSNTGDIVKSIIMRIRASRLERNGLGCPPEDYPFWRTDKPRA